MNSHFLQSLKWQKYQELEGNKTFRLQADNDSILAILYQTSFCNYLSCPYGPSANTLSTLKTSLKTLKDLALKEKALFIRIEPIFSFKNSEIRQIAKSLHLKSQKSHDINPAHTWQLSLSQSESDLLSPMEKNKVRLWRNHHKKGLKIRISKNPDDIKILVNLLQTVGATESFTPQDENHLKNQLKSDFATLYIAELTTPQGPIPIAATLVYDSSDTRFYAHSASDYEHRKLTAGSILLIQTIIDAQQKGLKIYDFWGITTSNDQNHPWYGFTQYKKSFGGYQVDYAGTYDIILRPAKYRTYQILRHLNRLKRKISA